jgi:gliding motility-associated-like protein
MIMKITRIFTLVSALLLTSTASLKSQIVGPDVYMNGAYIEIGMRGDGGYEGIQTGTSPVPVGYHTRGVLSLFGFKANPQMNGWLSTAYDGDFFTPGSPENGWGMEIITASGVSVKKSNNCTGLIEMSGFNYSYTVDPITGCKTTSGVYQYVDAASGFDISFDITYKIKPLDVYYTTVVKVTNNSTSPVPEFYYYRNVDPDNNQSIGAGFTSTNTIVANPNPTCNKAHVKGIQNIPWVSYLGFAAAGPQYKVSKGGFSNRDGSDIWNGTGGLVTAVGATTVADEAISLAYQILNFAPGTTQEIKYVVILDDASADAAISNLFYLDYTGSLGGPAPECVTTIDSALTCSGNPVTISVSGPIVSDFTWSWSPATGLSTTTGPTTDAAPTVTTAYTVTGTPIGTCYTTPITQDILVEIFPGPDADYTDPGPQCNTFDLNTLSHSDLNLVPGASFGFYSTVPATLADTATGIFPTNIITATDVVYLVYWDASLGCINSELINLNWGGISATLSVIQPTCAGNDGQITVNVTSPGTFTFSLDGGPFVPGNVFTGLSLGTHTIDINDAAGCTLNLDTTLTNGALPTITSTFPLVNPTCLAVGNGSITVNAAGVNPPFQYSVDGGPYQASNVLTGLFDGPHTVTVMDNLGCTVSTTVSLVAGTFTIAPSATPTTVCIGQTTSLMATTGGGSGTISIIWDNGVPAGVPGIPQSVDPAGTTTYTVYATDGVGCQTASTTVTVIENPPLAVVVSPDVFICPGDTASISAVGSGGNAGPFNYVWTNNQTAGSLFGAGQLVTPPNSPTIYTVSVTDGCGTPAVTASVTVTHFTLPGVNYTIDNPGGCTPQMVNFTNLTALTGSAAWDFGDGSTGIGNTAGHTYTNSSNVMECHDITLTITTVNGCVVDTTISNQICIAPIPQPNFSWQPNPTDIFNPDLTFVNLTIGGDTYAWDFAGLGTSNLINPEFTFPNDSGGVYPVCLTATSNQGCVATICHDVIIDGVFIIYTPNAFTPDGNGTNDIFLPILTGDEDGTYELFIFNRWGEVVFKSTDKLIGWDGNHNNIKAKEDTYVWKIKVKDQKNSKKYEYTGHITLLR